ncbi:hypothetical protein D3C86_1977770 [compost metagenome]
MAVRPEPASAAPSKGGSSLGQCAHSSFDKLRTNGIQRSGLNSITLFLVTALRGLASFTALRSNRENSVGP